MVCLDEQIKNEIVFHFVCTIRPRFKMISGKWTPKPSFHLSCIQNCSPIVLEKQHDVFTFSIMAVKRWNETALHLLLELCSLYLQISTAKVKVVQVNESSRGKEPEMRLQAHKGFTSDHTPPPHYSRIIKAYRRATNSQVLFPSQQQVNQQPRNHHKTPIIKQKLTLVK